MSDILTWEFDAEHDTIPAKGNNNFKDFVCDGLASGRYFKPDAERKAFLKLKELASHGKEKEYSELSQIILQHNMGLVYKAVSIYRSNTRGVTIEELISEGCLIITRAIRGFEPSHGFKFSTYCYFGLVRALSRLCKKPNVRVYQEAEHFDQLPAMNDDANDTNLVKSDVETQLKQLVSILSPKNKQLLYEYFGVVKAKEKSDQIVQSGRRRHVQAILRTLQAHVRAKFIEKCV